MKPVGGAGRSKGDGAARERARDFLEARRIAMVGVSRDEKDFCRLLMRELVGRGYDVVPVNPAATEIEGRRCYPRVQYASPPVEAALLLTPPEGTAQAVRDCLAAGVRRIWMHHGAGRGSASPEALALCAEAGVEPVTGLCPFMVLPGASLPHRVHGFVRRLGRLRPS